MSLPWRVATWLLAVWEHWVSMRGIVETRLSDPPIYGFPDEHHMRTSRRACCLCNYGLRHRGGWRWV